MPAVTQILNPVTRTVVRLIPPVEIMSDDELDDVMSMCAKLCREAWEETPRRDLAEIRDLRGWLRHDGG